MSSVRLNWSVVELKTPFHLHEYALFFSTVFSVGMCACLCSLITSVPGVVSLWEPWQSARHFRMQENNTDGGAELIALLWGSDPLTHTHTPLPLHNDTNTKWHNLMKFCSLKQVAVWDWGGGGVLAVRDALGSFSSSVSLNSFHEPIDVPVFSWPFSAVSHHWGMQIHIRTRPDTFPVAGAAARKRRGSAINEVRASFLRGPMGRERKTFSIKVFSLCADKTRV